MKRKIYGAASVAMAAATLAMPSAASADAVDAGLAECEPDIYTCVNDAVDLVQRVTRDAVDDVGPTVVALVCRVVPC